MATSGRRIKYLAGTLGRTGGRLDGDALDNQTLGLVTPKLGEWLLQFLRKTSDISVQKSAELTNLYRVGNQSLGNEWFLFMYLSVCHSL